VPDAGDDTLDWSVRAFVFAHIVEHGRPPSVAEAAGSTGLGEDDARAAYRRLHRRHAIFLDPGSDAIRMAHPFSGVPTPFRVHANGRTYWANCAWDALGIPAALRADATAEATLADTGQAVTIGVRDRTVRGHGEVVHFPLPFRRWYDDLIRT
jgi:hypothetical protein